MSWDPSWVEDHAFLEDHLVPEDRLVGHLDLEAEGLSFCRQAKELLAEVLADPLVVRVPSFLENPVLLVVQALSVSYLAGHLAHRVEVHVG